MGQFGDQLLALLFPQENACQTCGAALWRPDEKYLCVKCTDKLNKTRIPFVEQCLPGDSYTMCISAYYHALQASSLIHALKYENVAVAAEILAPAMADVLIRNGVAAAVDVAVPVPVHTSRLRERGYNQAELLADRVCERVSLPLVAPALQRVSGGKSQVGGSGSERRMRRNRFAADPLFAAGKKVLVIDDVFTTGSTAEECARVLLDAGARQVYVLTATRSTRN